MYPLSSLALLTTHIDHEHLMVLELKHSFGDTNRSCSTLNNVLFGWLVNFCEEAVQIWEEVGQTMDDGKQARYDMTQVQDLLLWQSSLIPSLVGSLNGFVFPK